MAENGELEASIAGQSISLKNVSINTIATVATLIGVALVAYIVFTHQQDTKEASGQFVAALREQTIALKDQTIAAREQNCLMRFDQKERSERADFCKQIAR